MLKKKTYLHLPAATAAIASFLFFTPTGKAQEFPEGPAKQYVQQICQMCHQADFLLRQRRTQDDWKKTVARMSQKGAGGTSDMYDAVAAYMFRNFGKVEDTTKVNMNKAKAEEIVKTIGLTAEEAAAVVAYRDKHGDFREWGDLLVIYGVDGEKVELARDKMTF